MLSNMSHPLILYSSCPKLSIGAAISAPSSCCSALVEGQFSMIAIHDLKEDFLASHAGNPLENVFDTQFVCVDARKKQLISYMLLFLVMERFGNALFNLCFLLSKSEDVDEPNIVLDIKHTKFVLTYFAETFLKNIIKHIIHPRCKRIYILLHLNACYITVNLTSMYWFSVGHTLHHVIPIHRNDLTKLELWNASVKCETSSCFLSPPFAYLWMEVNGMKNVAWLAL